MQVSSVQFVRCGPLLLTRRHATTTTRVDLVETLSACVFFTRATELDAVIMAHTVHSVARPKINDGSFGGFARVFKYKRAHCSGESFQTLLLTDNEVFSVAACAAVTNRAAANEYLSTRVLVRVP